MIQETIDRATAGIALWLMFGGALDRLLPALLSATPFVPKNCLYSMDNFYIGQLNLTPMPIIDWFVIDHQYFQDDVIKWKHFPCYWPFVWWIHQSPVNSPHKGQWRGALMFSFIYAWIYSWVNNSEAGDLRRHRVHYDVIVMLAAKPYIMLPVTFRKHRIRQCY